jgi:hypothetical protein
MSRVRGTKRQERLNADGSGFTLNTQMVRRGSEAVDHAFDFQTWFAEIKEQAEP